VGLNNYRDETGIFLEKIGAENEGVEAKVKMLEEEFNILKASIGNEDKLRHKIYDMLFLLFEIASEYNVDLDLEWNTGREHKQNKYINKAP